MVVDTLFLIPLHTALFAFTLTMASMHVRAKKHCTYAHTYTHTRTHTHTYARTHAYTHYIHTCV